MSLTGHRSFGLVLRFPCPLPKRISSRILSNSIFIPQNHPKSQQRVRTCAVIEKPVFRASLALSMLEIELYQISLPYDCGRSGYEIRLSVAFLVHIKDITNASCIQEKHQNQGGVLHHEELKAGGVVLYFLVLEHFQSLSGI